jgi:hypothetical protein
MKFQTSARYMNRSGHIVRLADLEAQFDGLREKRPAIYTDFFRWIEFLVDWQLIFPV